MPKKVLGVAEKPSVAKELAAILSAATRRAERPAKYNALWDFTTALDGGQCQMTMTSVTGHLMELDFGDGHRKWGSCDPVEAFDAPVFMGVPGEKKDLEAQLQQAVAGCDELILWLDCDREGEAIGFEVIQVCTKRRPRLRVRARASRRSSRPTSTAMRTLVQPDQNASDAVAARQEVDLRLGAAFTRLQTKTLQNRFEGLDSLLSYGPCQFPTMWFVEQRAERIAAFVAEDFWKIELAHEATDEAGSPMRCSFNWARGHLFDRLAVLVLYEACVRAASRRSSRSAAARRVSGGRRRSRRSSCRRTRAASCGSVGQGDGDRRAAVPGGLPLVPAHRDRQVQGGLRPPRADPGADRRRPLGRPRERAAQRRLRVAARQRPRRQRPPADPPGEGGSALAGDRAKLYEYVARRFLGCCCATRSATRPTSRRSSRASGSTSGLMVTELNFLKVYTYERWAARNIPVFHEGEHFTPSSLRMAQGSTTAPSPLTEAELIAEMDTNEIGTDATIAEHIKKVLERDYCTKQRQGAVEYFYPTPTGKMLLKGYRPLGFDLGKPTLRAEMERKQNAVAAGQLSKAQCVREIVDIMRDLYRNAARNVGSLVAAARAEFAPIDASRWPAQRLAGGPSTAAAAADRCSCT